MGCFCLAGSPLCGSGQACWSKLVEQWFSPSSFPRYKKTPLHAVRFCVYGALGWIDQRHPMGCFCLAGSPLCGSGQACWSKLVEQWFSPSSFPRYKKTPLHAVRFCVYGALGWIRTTDRSVRSRVLYPAELRVHWGLFSEDGHYR